jgi:hypothetical protein
MECERCDELELRYSKRTEKYISLIERQNRMFRNCEAKAGRDLDAKINEAKASRQEALRELNLHAKSHEN